MRDLAFQVGSRLHRSPIPRLRIGSELITRKGVVFRVREAIVLVAENGGESPSVVVERIREGEVVELLVTVGVLANMARGATHRRGEGTLIDWSQALRRPFCDVCGSGPQLRHRWRI